ncbi:MAG: hypothetical protein M1837_003290 [Sclerophora amabilis]|nr:MAG: hypothetical protein M1837_003290 [Sclerophora amabilis]
MASSTPVEDVMRAKASNAEDRPIIRYLVVITSEQFRSKMQPARHRMVYALLKEEMERVGGIHALRLRTQTPEEEERRKARELQEERGETGAGSSHE